MLAKQKKILEETQWTNPKADKIESQPELESQVKQLQGELEKI